VRRIEALKDGAEVVGNRTRAKVVKNKLAPPFRSAEFDILYGQGISKEGSLLDVGVDVGLIKKSGAWFTYDGDQLGQGRENARNFLRDNPELAREIEGEMGDSHVGLQARLMSQALRKLSGTIAKSKTTAVFINQLREKIGVLFGSPETTSGGRALKFYASVRLDVRRIEALKDGAEVVGNRTRAKVVKNKLAPPFRSAEFDVIYGQGISKEGSLLDVGVDVGLVKKSGAWFTYDGDQLGQGRENARNFLRDNPELAREIEEKVKAQLGIGLPPAPVPEPDESQPQAKDQDQDRDKL
jgi:hypothetical protein